MAMTARLWSISALAVELDMDRRTVAARLRAVPPDGTLRGHPAWRLPTALRATGGRVPAIPPAPPFGAEVLSEISSNIHAAMVTGALSCVYAVGRLVRYLAPESGTTDEQARDLAGMVSMALAAHCEGQFREMGVEPFRVAEPVWINPEALEWRPDREASEEAAA